MMRVDAEYRQLEGSIWLKRGSVIYGANWFGNGWIRKRALLNAMMQQNARWGAPWLWD
jgi:hypothetical protein